MLGNREANNEDRRKVPMISLFLVFLLHIFDIPFDFRRKILSEDCAPTKYIFCRSDQQPAELRGNHGSRLWHHQRREQIPDLGDQLTEIRLSCEV